MSASSGKPLGPSHLIGFEDVEINRALTGMARLSDGEALAIHLDPQQGRGTSGMGGVKAKWGLGTGDWAHEAVFQMVVSS